MYLAQLTNKSIMVMPKSYFNIFRQNVHGLCLMVAIVFSVFYNRIVVSDWMMDDAFISFRYAEHWAQGLGPVYNPGEPPVEGYTNFLWMALLALGARLGGDIVWLSRLFGATSGILTLLLLYNADRIIPSLDKFMCVLATLLLASCSIFQAWPTSGMETSFFGLLIMLGFLLHFRILYYGSSWKSSSLLGIICALLAMTRPEGLLVVALILADQTLESICKRNYHVFIVVVLFTALYLPYFLWRWNYYGDLVPNTFHAKVGFTMLQVRRGQEYFHQMTTAAWPLLLPAALAVFVPWVWFRRFGRFFLLPAFLLTYTLYVIGVGGDGLPAFRFFAPLAAPLCLLAAVGIRRIIPTQAITVLFGVFIIALNVFIAFSHKDTYGHLRNGDYVQKKGTSVGKWLRQRAPAGTVIATNTAGTIPYYSKLKTIDMLGLNDRHIAHRLVPFMGHGYAGHEKGDGDYVFRLQPDIVQFASASGSIRPGVLFMGDRELFNIPGFQESYELREYCLDDGSPLYLYVRRDSPFARDERDEVFEDFESGTYANWTLEGDCFLDTPAQGALPGQHFIQAYQGRFLMNTKGTYKEAKGKAISRPFIIRHNYIRFLFGGGYFDEVTMNLIVEGVRVCTSSPRNGYILLPHIWDISKYYGKEAVIEISDTSEHQRGFALVDDIVFSNRFESPETLAQDLVNPGSGLLPWLLAGVGTVCFILTRRKTPLSLAEKGILLLLVLFVVVFLRTAWVCDDAYITMRAVDNFIRGYGLTWNTFERVQAYTHPLWMLFISFWYFFSRNIYLTLITVSFIVSMGVLCLMVWKIAPSPIAACSGLIVLLFSRAFVDFSSSGLENPLSHLLLVIFAILYFKRQWTPALLGCLTFVASLLVVNRMDLSLLVAPAVAYVWLSLRSRRATVVLFLAGLPVAAWLIFSLIYYGFPFPNTAYAKLGTGVAKIALIRQSLKYFYHTLSNDPLTLPAIALGIALPLYTKKDRYLPLALGITLYLFYVMRIGGDFMGHRFFTAPLLLAVIIIIRLIPQINTSVLLPATALLVLLSFFAPIVPLLSGKNFGEIKKNPIDMYGVCNERLFYYRSTGFLYWRPGMLMPRDGWALNICKYAMVKQPLVRIQFMIGFQGFFSGPYVRMIDPLALSDPLLARLPAMKATLLDRLPPATSNLLRIGHFERCVPEGYVKTLYSGTNQIEDKNLAAFYDKLCIITQGPIFSWRRWRTIFEMNLGMYDHLIDRKKYIEASSPIAMYL